MTAQQKSLRDQENERQWKMLQAARAREQQLQQQMVVQGNPSDPNQSPHDPSVMGLQSPTGFLPPTNKPRPGLFPQTGMIRPVSVQIPRQRLGQNPFSPQSQSSQSPMEQYPSSPAQQLMDMVTHSPSEQQTHDSLTQSPHTPRSFDMQSPNSGMRSPAYAGGGGVANTAGMQPGQNPYTMPPGTPRPGQATQQVRPTVYARDMFGGQFAFGQDQYSGNNPQQQQQQQQMLPNPQNPNMPQQQPTQQQQPPHDGNRQLRDLLQRQQHSAPSSPSIGNTPQSPSNWNMEQGGVGGGMMDNQQQQHVQPQQQQSQQMMLQGMGGSDNNTFRLPLPPGAGVRPQRLQMINQNMMRVPNVINAPRIPGQLDIRQRMVRPKNMQGSMQQQQYGQQQQQMMAPNQQFSSLRMQGGMLVNSPMAQNNTIIQQQQQQGRPHGQEQMLGGHPVQDQATTQEQQEVAMIAESLQQNMAAPQIAGGVAGATVATAPTTGEGETAEIPENVTADLETLEQDDLFDEAFLGSLSGDFNILEYADPELDTLNDEDKSNLLDSLELDEPDNGGDKEDKQKKEVVGQELNFAAGDAAGPSNAMVQQQMPIQQQQQQQQMDPNVMNKEMVQHPQFQNMQQQQQQMPHPQQQQQQRIYQMKQPMQLPPNIQQIQQQMISQVS